MSLTQITSSLLWFNGNGQPVLPYSDLTWGEDPHDEKADLDPVKFRLIWPKNWSQNAFRMWKQFSPREMAISKEPNLFETIFLSEGSLFTKKNTFSRSWNSSHFLV